MPENTPSKGVAVILTALEVEYRAVRAHLHNPLEEIYKGTVYERGSFMAGQWDVGIVQVGAGNAKAAFEAERAIAYFNPQVVLFVGVAGGLKDVKLGDVVAARKVYGYESGKVWNSTFLVRPDVGESSYRLVQRASTEARRGEWVRGIEGRKPRKADIPRAFIGPIAAGEKVLSSTKSDLLSFLQQNYGDALAIEMEGRGFLDATHANEHIQALVIRGISDLINNKSQVDTQGYQEIASRHASAFAYEILAKLDAGETQPAKPAIQSQQLSEAHDKVQIAPKDTQEASDADQADNPYNILHLATRITTPLSLAALVILVLYLLYRAVLGLGNFPSLTQGSTFQLLNSLLDKVFILALIALVLAMLIYALVRVLDHRARVHDLESKANKSPTLRAKPLQAIEKKEGRLHLVDVFVHEKDSSPVLDITLHNAGDQTAFPKRARIDILDAGEFYHCNDTPETDRSLIAVTQNYSIELSPKLKGSNQTAKIAHQLLPGDSDRFQLTINQYLDDPSVVFVWYYLGVTLLASDEADSIAAEPLLLSVPPTRMYPGIWEPVSRSPCIQKNRETLQRMAGLKANRSDSVEAAIRVVLEASK